MDKDTDARFKEAVERKKDEAREASHQHSGDASPPSDQDPSQDVVTPREDTSRHGQVTADKWNQ
jgi:hypothetical protein